MNRFRFLMPIGFLAIAAGFAAVVMLLWNWLIPVIFGLGAICFWQALGLLVLCRILFGSFGGGHGMMRRNHHAGGHPMLNKWKKMTPEQRKEFLNRRKAHCANSDFFGENFGFDETEPKEEN